MGKKVVLVLAIGAIAWGGNWGWRAYWNHETRVEIKDTKELIKWLWAGESGHPPGFEPILQGSRPAWSAYWADVHLEVITFTHQKESPRHLSFEGQGQLRGHCRNKMHRHCHRWIGFDSPNYEHPYPRGVVDCLCPDPSHKN